MTTLTKTKQNGNLLPTVFSDFFNADRFFGPKWFEGEFEQTLPSVNIKEGREAFSIELAAPGFAKDDFKIDLEEGVLTISAEKKEEKSEKEDRYTRKEYSYNSFSRSFALPQNSNADGIEANYSDGILKLKLPKKEVDKENKKKEIKVS